ncbi:Hypothetical predicted protein [Lynx pardinus]|uniref:Shieldin complex subunit 1 C-terminal domain-containing protein n=1 Tax=Lynx pardinus TaxID=191816 RepID=A0A485MTJ3_LYNPA|nr:Hypothetical predicted protein [Lynx pardinus]
MLSDLPKVTQPVSGHAGTQTQAFQTQPMLVSISSIRTETVRFLIYDYELFYRSQNLNSYTSNLNSEQNDSWTSENFWLDPSVKGQVKTKAEDDGLRKSLDRFYEVFGCPQPASGNALSAAVCQCLSQKINELKGQESRKYALRSFQMARVIFNRDGCSVLQRHSRDVHFYPSGEGSVSLDDEKPTPGLSKDIIHFLLQQNVMKDL